jgi:hypothetical protein
MDTESLGMSSVVTLAIDGLGSGGQVKTCSDLEVNSISTDFHKICQQWKSPFISPAYVSRVGLGGCAVFG